jgi:hypothetical protein
MWNLKYTILPTPTWKLLTASANILKLPDNTQQYWQQMLVGSTRSDYA